MFYELCLHQGGRVHINRVSPANTVNMTPSSALQVNVFQYTKLLLLIKHVINSLMKSDLFPNVLMFTQ
jgi:hypothetical protein